MREFNYSLIRERKWDSELLELIAAIYKEAGKQELYFNEICAYEQRLDFLTARDKCRTYVEMYPTDEEGAKELEFLNREEMAKDARKALTDVGMNIEEFAATKMMR